MGWSSLSGASKAALIFAVLGFVISFTSTSQSTINGVSTCSHMDFAALILGGMTMLAASAGLLRIRDAAAETRTLNLAILVVADIVGVVHILRGIGMVGGPCG